MRYRPIVAMLLLAAGTAGAVQWYRTGTLPGFSPATQQAPSQKGFGRRNIQGDGPAPVSAALVEKRSVPVYREGIGNVLALNAVTVRAQVDGRLLTVDFVEGQDVKKGQLLARIDPVTYKALYDQAVAKKAQDEANLANLRIDLERYRRLAATNAGPKQQADQQVALVAQMMAQIQSDVAAIANAKATLDYTTISSPLDGKVGLRQVDPGNIVHAADAGGIVSVTQVKPIGVLFTLPQRDLAATAAALRKGAVVVEIPNPDKSAVLVRGTLKSIDNQIDLATGTIKLKAEFANDNQELWPGQFVSIRVVVDQLVDAKVVPASTIRRGTAGNFVYVVGDDRKASVRPVAVVLQNEEIAVVGDGLDFGQMVVTQGFARLTDGKVVETAAPGDGGARGAGKGAVQPDGGRGETGEKSEKGDGEREGKGGKRGAGRNGPAAAVETGSQGGAQAAPIQAAPIQAAPTDADAKRARWRQQKDGGGPAAASDKPEPATGGGKDARKDIGR